MRRVARARTSYLASLVAVTLVAWAMRAWVNCASAWPAGMDAGYYPLQTRALLEHGRLAYFDLPLVFVLQAGVARLIMLLAHCPLDDAVVLAARLTDTLVPPLVALPLVALACRLAGPDTRRARLVAATTVATVSLPMLRMTGDYQKNSVGLLWLAGLAWALQVALARGGPRRWAQVGLCVLLAGLTHVAVCGAAVVLCAATVGAYATVEQPPSRRQLGLGLAVAAAAFGCVLAASPPRALALLAAPVKLLWHPRGAPRLDPLGRLVCVSVYATLAWGGVLLWRERRTILPADLAVLVGAGVCAALLACPLLAEDYFKRLVLMAPVPAAVVLAYALSRTSAVWPARTVVVLSLLSVAIGLSGGEFSRGIAPTVITADEALELRAWRPWLAESPHTVVLADKGLMWWAGFLLRVPVRQDRVRPDAVAKYQRVLWLEVKHPHHPPEPPHPGPPPPGGTWAAGSGVRDGTQFRLSTAVTVATGAAATSPGTCR